MLIRSGERQPWLRAVLSGVVIVALTVSMLGYLTKLVENKRSYQKYASFFQQEADYDVLFLGTSHVVNGVFPMELWKNYGIVSYNFGGYANTLAVTNWALENALNLTSPKVIVIDCHYLSKNNLTGPIGDTHVALDAFPISTTKINAALDLTDSLEHCMELLWNFSMYHDRWSDLNKRDFSLYSSPEKGVESQFAVVEGKFNAIDKSRYLSEDTLGVQYLCKMIQTCKERGIPVLLTYLPFPAADTEQMEANRAALIADEYDIDYINFLDMNVVDFKTDCYDAHSHLNTSGARKVTDYLGRFIVEHYNVPDRRDHPDYIGWYDDYTAYTQFKIANLAAQKDIKTYLMMLQDKQFSSCVYLTERGPWNNDSIYDKLLANMGIDSDSLVTGGPTLAVVDNEREKVHYLAYGDAVETSFGTVLLELTDGTPQVLVNERVGLKPVDGAAAAALVIDNDTGKAVTSSQFSITEASVNKMS